MKSPWDKQYWSMSKPIYGIDTIIVNIEAIEVIDNYHFPLTGEW